MDYRPDDVQPLIYQRLAAERLLDVPEPGPTVPELRAQVDDSVDRLERRLVDLDRVDVFGYDAQSVAYRGMTLADVVLDDELDALTGRRHPPYVPGADVRPATVEEYEAAEWDRDRIDPRPDQ